MRGAGANGEAHSSSHYGRWLLWYFSLSIRVGGGRGANPRGGPGACSTFQHFHPSSLHPHLPQPSSCPSLPPPPPPQQRSLPCFSSDSSPSDCYYSPFLLRSITPSPTLSPTSITSHTHTHTHPSMHNSQHFPCALPFLHPSWEAALDSQMSRACQKLLLTFQFAVLFPSLLPLAALC